MASAQGAVDVRQGVRAGLYPQTTHVHLCAAPPTPSTTVRRNPFSKQRQQRMRANDIGTRRTGRALHALSWAPTGQRDASSRRSSSSSSSMGNKVVTFSDQQLEDYQDCTFFTRKEILRVHKHYRAIRPDLVPKRMTGGQAGSVRVPREDIELLDELRENPFKRRICEAFSRDGVGNLSFEDFLDLLSVFSEHAPRDIKVYYAFKIYDFDKDGFIGPTDLKAVIRALTRNELTTDEHQQIADKVIEEADVDGDGKLSFLEFEHVITRAPDFLSTFHIRL